MWFKLPGGVGSTRDLGKMGTSHRSTHPPMDGGHILYRPGGGIWHFVVEDRAVVVIFIQGFHGSMFSFSARKNVFRHS
jgi:hypothetical protein